MEVFKKPVNDYEKFVNAFACHEQGKHATKLRLIKKATDRWNEVKHDGEVIQRYISSAPKPRFRQAVLNFTAVPRVSQPTPTLATCAAIPETVNSMLPHPLATTPTTSSSLRSQSSTSFVLPILGDLSNEERRENTSQPEGPKFEVRCVAEFFEKLCPSLLTEDVMKNESFVSSFSKCVGKLSQFHELYKSYSAHTQRSSKTKFRENLTGVATEVKACFDLMKETGSITLTVSQGTAHLSVLANKKNELLSKIICSSLSILSELSDKRILSKLQKRCNQQAEEPVMKAFTTTDITLSCRNSHLSWTQAFNNFESCSTEKLPKEVSSTSVRYAAEQIEHDTFVCAGGLNLTCHSQEIIDAVVSNFPVLCLTRMGNIMLIDIHGLLLGGGAFTSLLNGDDPTSNFDQISSSSNSECAQDDAVRSPIFGPRQKRGRRPMHERYPELVNEVSSFIKQHSFSAHGRRRETTGTGVGVTLLQIRNHVLATIPELVDISTDTIHRLMVAPKKSTIAAARYRGLVQARVPKTGRNDYRENHENQHFLFARVAYREEFCSKHSDECTFFSCDDMAKIRMGPAPAVSRYHQERRFFAKGDEPNLPDHDTPNPGYLLNSSGYQELVVNKQRKDVVDQAYTAEEENDIIQESGFILEDELMDKEMSQNNKKSFRDKLGRLHYHRYMSGPTKLVLRAVKFSPSNAMNHVNDLLPELASLLEKGIGIAFVKIDNGGDWNLANLVNEIYFCRMWKESKLDVLAFVSYAARFSAYNNIEHTWAPMSKKLTSVILPSVLEGDEAEPYKLGIPHDEVTAKEAKVFDNAMKLVTEKYWANATFNGSEVTATMVPSLGPNYPFDDFEHVHTLIMGPYSRLINDATMMAELRFLFQHMDKKSNEVIFQKCSRPSCKHCTSNPVVAKKAWGALIENEFKWPNPVPSEAFPGHYKTFMEVDADPPSSFATGEVGLPNSLKVGTCPFCSFMFMSAAERDKHMKVMHRDRKHAYSKEHKCLHVIKENKCAKRCNLLFKSNYELLQHRKLVGHIRKRRTTTTSSGIPSKVLISTASTKTKKTPPQRKSAPHFDSESDITDDEISDEAVDKGHPCTGVLNKKVDKNKCEKCQEVYGPGSGDWLKCKLCRNWYHEACF